jgi:hypothetical protein
VNGSAGEGEPNKRLSTCAGIRHNMQRQSTQPSRPTHLRFTAPQAMIVLLTIGVTVPLATLFIGGRGADDFISERLSQSELEQRFGFVAAPVPDGQGIGNPRPIRIVAVTPGGPFSRAGVRVGDIPAIGTPNNSETTLFFEGCFRGGNDFVELVFLRGPSLTPVTVSVEHSKSAGSSN